MGAVWLRAGLALRPSLAKGRLDLSRAAHSREALYFGGCSDMKILKPTDLKHLPGWWTET